MRYTFDIQYCATGDKPSQNIMTCSFTAAPGADLNKLADAIFNAVQESGIISEMQRIYERTDVMKIMM